MSKEDPQPSSTAPHAAGPADRAGCRVLGGLGLGLLAVLALTLALLPYFKLGLQVVAIAPFLILLAPVFLFFLLIAFVLAGVAGSTAGAAFSPGIFDSARQAVRNWRTNSGSDRLNADSQTAPWKYVGVAFKGRHISIDGVNPWGRAWRPIEEDSVVELPVPKAGDELRDFQVYRLGVSDRDIVFAAREVSPSEFAFYVKTRMGEPKQS